MLKQRLEIRDFKKIICVGFSKDVVWSFKPKILENKILLFIEEMNSIRNMPVKS